MKKTRFDMLKYFNFKIKLRRQLSMDTRMDKLPLLYPDPAVTAKV